MPGVIIHRNCSPTRMPMAPNSRAVFFYCSMLETVLPMHRVLKRISLLTGATSFMGPILPCLFKVRILESSPMNGRLGILLQCQFSQRHSKTSQCTGRNIIGITS